MPTVAVLVGPHDAGKYCPIKESTITIGRDPGNTFQLRDPRVSRRHARIAFHADERAYYVEDMGSEAGVIIRNIRISRPYRLDNNTQMILGDTTLLFTTQDLREGESVHNLFKDIRQGGIPTVND